MTIVILAIISQVFSSALTALGYALQKQAHVKVKETGKSIMKQIRFWAGILAMFSSIPFTLRK